MSEHESNLKNESRRKALQALGCGALSVLAAGSIAGVASAQQTTVTPGIRPPVQIRPEILQLQDARLATLDRSRLTAIGLTRRLPPNTGISQLGLTPEAIGVLTPNARLLTKADLEALGRGSILGNPRLSALTVQDVASIRDAFGNGFRPALGRAGGLASIDVSCCCCTPCCCAAAVSTPLAIAA